MKIYAEVLEYEAKKQFESAMEQDYVVDGALMADAHTGYALPIGAVVSTKDKVVPAWVGYDIGCGMCALKLNNITKKDLEYHEKPIFKAIYKNIPVGFNTNKTLTNYSTKGLTAKGKKIAEAKKYQSALGSLGGGNHFIEIGYDEHEAVWVIIHSGSRGVGHGIASHYMKIAKEINTVMSPETYKELEKTFDFKNQKLRSYKTDKEYNLLRDRFIQKNKPKVNKILDGHYGLDTKSQYGKDYIQDLHWCLNYALDNRKIMMKRVVGCITESLNRPFYNLNFSGLINRNHNHAELKDGLWIHRKGATHAEKDMLGVIPGNMLDGSFIVKGKGNPDSLYSSSHGAGRILSRSKAKETLKLNDFKDIMEGITASVKQATLDESPFAYKNIFDVMNLQEELVEVIAHVKPLINIKG